MAWFRIDPRLLKQDDPQRRTVMYWDDGPLDRGELLLWMDQAGNVTAFQLAHAKFLASREYLAEWHRGGTLRLGEVAGEGGAARFKTAPTVRYGALDESVLGQLREYFARNAEALEPREREAVAAALGGNEPGAGPRPPDPGGLPSAPQP